MVVKPLDDVPAAVVAALHPGGTARAVTAAPIPVDHITTDSLVVHHGTSTGPDGERRWSVVAKTLRPPSASPIWASIPEPFRPAVVEQLDWTAERAAYTSGLAASLPDGVRLPELLLVTDAGAGDEARTTLWLEHVADDPSWDDGRYHASARALGALAGAHAAEVATTFGARPRSWRGFLEGKVAIHDVPLLSDAATWAHPCFAPHDAADLGPRLLSLAARAPALLDRLERLPTRLAHGDACPANLLRSRPGADVTVIDWGFIGLQAPGGDLALVLVAGRVEGGDLDPADVPAVEATVLDGYLAGLDDVGAAVAPDDVRWAFLATSALRSCFMAVPLDRLGESPSPALTELVGRRLAYVRHLLDVADQLLEPAS